MKLFVVFIAVSVCCAAKLDKTYLPPHSHNSGGTGGILQTPIKDARKGPNPYGPNAFAQSGNGFGPAGYAASDYRNTYEVVSRPERPRAALERNAAIIRQDKSNDGERYSYAYETENGIYAEENGVASSGIEAQGGFSYTGDDGQLYSIRYTADQNGFVPQGEHLPTPPPVPEEIQRSLEQNARDEAAGVYDDGSYNADKYGDVEATNIGYTYPTSQGYSAVNSQDSASANGLPRGPAPAHTVATFGVPKSYLPPFANQKTAGRPSYNFRAGYRY